MFQWDEDIDAFMSNIFGTIFFIVTAIFQSQDDIGSFAWEMKTCHFVKSWSINWLLK